MKPVIFGCAGPALSDAERAFFETEQPAGFILFARNIQSPQQVKTLTTDLRLCVDRNDVLIAIDQEGGRVQRMGSPHWKIYPPMGTFGHAAKVDFDLAAEALKLNCLLLADDLRRVGVNVDCLPLLDVPQDGADNVIGDRALGATVDMVSGLGRIVIDSLQEAGVLPVMKHLPGHGRATVDSHKLLPRVDTIFEELVNTDFAPFRALSDCPLGMTAHIVYEAIDNELPATLSPTVVGNVIRGLIGFNGLLMTDDLSMQALSGSVGDRAIGALSAGCDLILHCNGDMKEMRQIANVLPLGGESLRHSVGGMIEAIGKATPIDRKETEARYVAKMRALNKLI